MLGIVIQHHFHYIVYILKREIKMPRSKKSSAAQFEKVLQILVTNAPDGTAGRVVPVAEIQEVLGNEIQLARMSVYMYEIKKAGCPLRPIREGKKVIAYQLPLVQQAMVYLNTRGLMPFLAEAVTEEAPAEPIVKKSKKSAKKVTEVKEEDYTPPQWIDNETGEVITDEC